MRTTIRFSSGWDATIRQLKVRVWGLSLLGVLLLAGVAGIQVGRWVAAVRLPCVMDQPSAVVAESVRSNPTVASRRYPRGQIQADMRTFLHMLRYVLEPEMPAVVWPARVAV